MFYADQNTYPLSRSNGLPPQQDMAAMIDRDFCFVPLVTNPRKRKVPLASIAQRARSMLGAAKRKEQMDARHELHKPEIIRLLAEGKTMQQIGAAIGMSTTYTFKCIKLNGLDK